MWPAVGLMVLLAALCVALRVRWCLLPRSSRPRPRVGVRASTLVVLGSGGHTSEMLALLKGLDGDRYAPLHVVVAGTDKTSLPRLESTMPDLATRCTVHVIRRSREVGQSFVSSVLPTLLAAAESALLVLRAKPDVVLCNGPGTCVPVVAGALLARFLGVCDPSIVFVESFCRVESLSLTGRLLYRVADRFVVQWAELARRFPERAEYLGILF
jgi:beta-1,4-N-acetylglucosaminyltransferase